jgi:uncharacterized glyoxalase superfamily protein PhnB
MANIYKSITPNLIVSDIDRSTSFYRDALGFSIVETVPAQAPFAFVMLVRDGINLFLNSEAAAREGGYAVEVGRGGVALYIMVEGIGAFWKELQARAPIVMALTKQFYGMTEFSVTDPDGYYITFAERIEQVE